MKRIVEATIITISLLLYFSCHTEKKMYHKDIQNKNVSDSLYELLLDDARIITMSHLLCSQKEEKRNITLPDQNIKAVLIALQCLYTSKDKTPLLIQKLAIHAQCPQQLYQLKIHANHKNTAIKAWIKEKPTGSAQLDGLISTYNLSLQTIDSNIFIVSSRKRLNTWALAEHLQQNPFITQTKPIPCLNNESQITLIDLNYSYLDFGFSYDWGDCSSGYKYHHFWTIRISSNGEWELLKEKGDPLPITPKF